MNLAALDESRFAGVTSHSRVQRFAAIQDVEPRRAEVQSALRQFTEQRAYHRRIFRRALTNSQHRLGSIAANAKAAIICRSLNGVPSISTAHSRTSPSPPPLTSFTFPPLP